MVNPVIWFYDITLKKIMLIALNSYFVFEKHYDQNYINPLNLNEFVHNPFANFQEFS